MNYIKMFVIITMLTGVEYAACPEYMDGSGGPRNVLDIELLVNCVPWGEGDVPGEDIVCGDNWDSPEKDVEILQDKIIEQLEANIRFLRNSVTRLELEIFELKGENKLLKMKLKETSTTLQKTQGFYDDGNYVE